MRALVLLGIFVLTVAVCVTVSLVTVKLVTDTQYNSQLSETENVGSTGATFLTDAVTDVVEAAAVLDGLLQGYFITVPTGAAAASTRLPEAILNFTWQTLNGTAIGLRGIGFAPNGVWSQTVLPLYTPSFYQYDAAWIVSLPQQSSVVVLNAASGFDVIRPVVNCSTCTALWGIVGVRFALPDLLPAMMATFTSHDHAVAVQAPDFSGQMLTVAQNANVPSDFANPDLVLTIDVNHYTSAGKATWSVLVWRTSGFTSFSGSSSVSACIVASFAGGVLVVIIVLIIDACCASETTPGASEVSAHIPLEAPFFVIATEIDRAGQVWAVEPQYASDVQRLFGEAVKPSAHRCHVAQHIGERMLVVSRTASDALSFAEALAVWAASQQWPETVHVQLGRRLPFRLRTALHYCEEAIVTAQKTFNEAQPPLHFAGPDIDSACELRSFSPAGRITASQSFFEAAVREKVPESAFTYLGTSVPNDDGRSFEGYVYNRGESMLDSLELSASDAEFWSKNELIADAVSVNRKFQSSGTGRPLLRGRSVTESGNQPEFSDVLRHSSTASAGRARSSVAAVATRQSITDLVLSHPVFIRFDHAPWLPSKTCDGADVKTLHHLLQEYVTSQDEANHYSTLLVLSTYFFQAYTFILRPLALVEQRNIMRRLQMTFGIPERGFAHRLAVQCAVIGFRALPNRAKSAVLTSPPLGGSMP